MRLAPGLQQAHPSLARLHRGFERAAQAFRGFRLDDHPVDDDVDRFPRCDGRGEHLRVDLLESGGLAAQPQPRVPRFFHCLQRVFLPLPQPERQRRQDDETGARGQGGCGLEQLLEAVGVHRGAAPQAAGPADLGVKSADVVVEAGRGRRGRAGIASPGAGLVRGQGGGQPVDAGDPGPAQPGRRGPRPGCIERREETTPRLGVEGVEHQGGFPRAGDAADGHEPPVREIDVDLAEVVLRGPADGDGAVHSIVLPGEVCPAGSRQDTHRAARRVPAEDRPVP